MIDVLIPTMNRAHTISRAIDSVLKQTYSDFKIIIIDNASDDDTSTLISRNYGKELDSGLIKYVYHEDLVPIHHNWNRCLLLSQSQYCTFLFSDDTFEPDYLSKVINAFHDKPDLALVSSPIKYVDQDTGRTIHTRSYGSNKKVAILKSIFMRNSIGAPTCVSFNNQIIKQNSLLFTDNRVACDIIFMAELLTFGDYYYIDEPLSSLYVSRETETSTLKSKPLWVYDNVESKSIMYSIYLKLFGSGGINLLYKPFLSVYCSVILATVSKEDFYELKLYLNENKIYSSPIYYLMNALLKIPFIKTKVILS